MSQTGLTTVSYLYVEDNDDVRASFCELIASPYRDITAVGSAESALAVAADRRFDVLITDVSLPGMSGIDLVRRWRVDDPQGWVVLCSGYELRDALRALGPHTRLLPKTFELEDCEALLDDIETCLRTRGASAAGDPHGV